MIDFLNEHLPNLNVDILSLQFIYIDDLLVDNNLINFNSELLDNIKDYYLSKNNFNIIKYSLLFTGPNCKYNDKDYVFTLTNVNNKHSIVVSLNKQNNFATIEFYININNRNKIVNKTNIKGTIFVLSNFVNNGIGVQLLDILYQYLENEHFDEHSPFCNILIN